MTIGIGASGQNAGLAVWRALNRVERVATGSIGGFATFAVLTSAGNAHIYTTQRGGSRTLFTEGDTVLEEPPATVVAAPMAAVISSGPDRPEPLSQFLAVKSDVGLVTGHRLPNRPGPDGEPLNQQVLQRLEDGATPVEAVDAITEVNPAADAGFIAVSSDGAVAAGNTRKVVQRPDTAQASQHGNTFGIAVMLNAITPADAVAALAASIGSTHIEPESEAAMTIQVAAGISVEHGSQDLVEVDESNTVNRIQTSDETLLSGEQVGAVPYLGSLVLRDGKRIGKTASEPNTVLKDGTITQLSGQDSFDISIHPHD